MKYKIIVDKQSSKNPSNEKKEYVVDIEELRVKGDIYDSLIITKDEDYVIRRLSLSKFHVLRVLDEPIKEKLPDLNIELFEGDNYIYLMDMEGNKFYAEYIVKNDFTDIYCTKNEMNSVINQTAQNIELSVNQKLIGYATTSEMNSKIEMKADSIISQVNNTFKNYDTSKEVSSKIEQKANSITSEVNNTFKNYSTTTQMNSAITQKADSITSAVSKTYATRGELNTAKSEIKQTTDSITSTVSKKVGKNEVCSMINQSADEILLKGNRVVIESNNFKLTKEGKITATEGIIGGFSLGTKQFTGNLNGIYDYNSFDLRTAMCIVLDCLYPSSTLRNIYDYDDDGTINSADFLKIQKILMGVNSNTKKISGTLKINSEDPKNCISIERNGQIVAGIGTGGVNAELVNTENILCGYAVGTSSDGFTGVTINGHTCEINCIKGGSIQTTVNYNEIRTPKLTQTSLENQKKNFEKMKNNAIDIIKEIDIYKYNLKSEKDTDKKHIGFIIGDNYNYSKEVTSIDNKGVDNYSFTSLCCKAIQELVKRNEELEKRIETLEKGVKND